MATGVIEQDPAASLPANEVPPQETAAPAQPVDTGEQQPATDASISNPPTESGASEKPRDEQGRFKAAENDPVEQAMSRLEKKPKPTAAKAEPDPKAETPPAKVETGKPSEPAKPAEAKKPDATSSTTDIADLNPPDDEKARWTPRTRERFDRLFGTLKETRTQLDELAPHAETGKQFAGMLDEYGVTDDIGFVPPQHLAGVIKAQASLNRAALAVEQGRAPARSDLEAIASMGKVVDDVRQRFGITQPAPEAPRIEPFTGPLPDDLKDLVEVYNIDEKRVRLLAAIERGAVPAAPAKPAAQAAPPPAPVQQPAADRPEGVDMAQLYARQWASELREAGDKNPAQTMRVVLAHPASRAEVMRRFPGTTPADVPAVFDALDPRERIDVLRAAHRAMSKPAVPVPTRPSTPPPPTKQTPLTGSAPRAAASAGQGDALDQALAYLSRPE